MYEKIYLNKGEIVNDSLIFNIKKNVKNYFKLKGFFFVSVKIVPVINRDLNNFVMLKIFINKGKKFKINNIFINGNNNFNKNIILKKMPNTKEVFKIKFFKVILKTFVNNLFNEFLNFFLKTKKKN